MSAMNADMLSPAFAASTRSQSATSSRSVMVTFFSAGFMTASLGSCHTEIVQHEIRVKARFVLSVTAEVALGATKPLG
jgi:hypothetical protein